MANIKDVAKLANTSITTVSRVLNNSGYVKEETKERILKVIKELNYNPNALARGLVTDVTKTIGLLLPDITNPYFANIAKAVEDAASKYDYSVFLCSTNGEIDKEIRYLEVLNQKRVDGIIYGTVIDGDEGIKKVKSMNIPVVVLDRGMDKLQIDTVMVDNIKGAFLATKYLMDNGHKNIAFIGGPNNTKTSLDRKKGYIKFLKSKNVEIDKNLISYGDFQIESGFNAMKQLIDRKVKIDAVFVANDLMAIGAINYLSKKGIDVPEEISVIGFDNVGLSSLTTPKLTTIEQPISEMSKISIELIMDQILEEENKYREIKLTPKIIVRESVSKKI
ncbi:transcriptional regulator, LacI family [Gottschalkia purinilytica]|uniref:Transcriptional regulator, LacI family n=1 Tax=Gottschalkia purinilytica TaxID=1503 RepID=A0A0L0W971_GOTPU|nr:LacI family DNA-binding transcriptional regulator [Gottschalkia purinilytica]KNF07865.1 transcriptional regulator, LacI family [Gottschalkia purinilytica]